MEVRRPHEPLALGRQLTAILTCLGIERQMVRMRNALTRTKSGNESLKLGITHRLAGHRTKVAAPRTR